MDACVRARARIGVLGNSRWRVCGRACDCLLARVCACVRLYAQSCVCMCVRVRVCVCAYGMCVCAHVRASRAREQTSMSGCMRGRASVHS